MLHKKFFLLLSLTPFAIQAITENSDENKSLIARQIFNVLSKQQNTTSKSDDNAQKPEFVIVDIAEEIVKDIQQKLQYKKQFDINLNKTNLVLKDVPNDIQNELKKTCISGMQAYNNAVNKFNILIEEANAYLIKNKESIKQDIDAAILQTRNAFNENNEDKVLDVNASNFVPNQEILEKHAVVFLPLTSVVKLSPEFTAQAAILTTEVINNLSVAYQKTRTFLIGGKVSGVLDQVETSLLKNAPDSGLLKDFVNFARKNRLNSSIKNGNDLQNAIKNYISTAISTDEQKANFLIDVFSAFGQELNY